jgi:HTH-type transcriptional regulator/antitoxin HigA
MAEAFSAGEFLADELEARGWTQAEFAEILGRPAQFVSEIISGKKEITRDSAAQIGAALGTSAELWLNLQDTYHLWLQSQDAEALAELDVVSTRARLHDLAPMKVLKERGYVQSTDPHGQAAEVLDLFGMDSFDDPPAMRFVARRSNGDERITVTQNAWAACVHKDAEELSAQDYDATAFRKLAAQLTGLAQDPEAFQTFQQRFADVGVKLVYVEAFPRSKVDGCALLVDGTPIIGLSGRGKRMDKILFTLLHEVAHVLKGHLDENGQTIIDDLESSGGERTIEEEADALAAQLAIPKDIAEIPERINANWVEAEAARLKVHPITLIGRLQKDGHLSWRTSLVRGAPNVTNYLEQWQPRPIASKD